jgi:hypothetical protein
VLTTPPPPHISNAPFSIWLQIVARKSHQSSRDASLTRSSLRYIDQSQSLNIHMAAPTFPKMTSLHFYAWNKGIPFVKSPPHSLTKRRSHVAGLKTGMYYLRTRPAGSPPLVCVCFLLFDSCFLLPADAIQFTVDKPQAVASSAVEGMTTPKKVERANSLGFGEGLDYRPRGSGPESPEQKEQDGTHGWAVFFLATFC